MPRYAPNKMPSAVKRRYFELIRTGLSGSAAAEAVGVSLSCGALWFIDAGSVTVLDVSISSRYFHQEDRMEIAGGLDSGESVKAIAARIAKNYQSVYREITRNKKPGGRYQPWYAHNQAHVRPRAPRQVASWSTTCSGKSSPTSSRRNGHPLRSAGGFVVTGATPVGMSVPKRSAKRSTGV